VAHVRVTRILTLMVHARVDIVFMDLGLVLFIILRVNFKVYSELVMFGASVVDLHHIDDECRLTDDLGVVIDRLQKT
jgi:hypothetical protein